MDERAQKVPTAYLYKIDILHYVFHLLDDWNFLRLVKFDQTNFEDGLCGGSSSVIVFFLLFFFLERTIECNAHPSRQDY